MSGDVQPRKRKDKKRKKDDLGVDEPRGTAAALGEGDVFMHSHHDHGTGGHWCAKVIFFSLLFVLVGLIGLIILENRGLSELEANAVQSQYSNVLEGWLEDAPEDDHHDEHTLELNHHDDEHDEEVEHSEEAGDDHDEDEEHEDHDDEDEQDDEPQEEEDDEEGDEENNDDQDEDGSQEQDLEDIDEEEDLPYRKYYHDNEAVADDDDENEDDEDDQDDDLKNDDDDDEQDDNISKNDDEDDNASKNDDDEEEEQLSNEVDQNDDDDDENNLDVDEDDENNANGDSNEQNNEDEEDHEEEEEDTSLEVEKIEKEAPEDEEPISNELPALPEQDDDDDDDDKDQDSAEDESPDADENDGDGDDADEADDANDADDFLEADDDEPPVERITAPSGKPFDEVEEPSTEKPTDTLEDEEEYEKRQEQLRKEEAEASHMWLKLSIGGALLVATHAIVRRATASSDAPRSEEQTSREATPAIDRRMTLIPEEPSEPVPIKKVSQESSRPVIQEIPKQIPSITRKSPTFEESEEEIEEEEEEEPVVSKVVRSVQAKAQEKKELYSDEEEEEEEEEPVIVKKVAPAAAKPPPKEPTPEPEEEPEEDVPDDVEIIDDENIEEEEEAEDEEEISDVDDEELLTRLEAKYGRLPEPERPARRKDGGNSIEDWPGEPADAYWRQQLDEAEREYNQGATMAAADRASAPQLKTSGRARWLIAKSLDAEAEKKRDNAMLGRAIAAYLELLKMNERLSDKKLLEIAERTINRIQFRGTYLSAEPVYRLLMRRFPEEPSHRTNLTVIFLMANRGDLAEDLLKETLERWPNDRLALAQYGFILKTQHNRLEEALDLLQRALEGDTGPATEPRFYYHLGDTLLLLGRFDEAHEIHKRGAAHGHFLSPAQRSLYNVPRLEGRPWWNIEDTPYIKLARDLESNWKTILKEGEAAKALYEQEKEGLKEKGEWSQLDIFVRGREIDGRCARAPVTCAVVRKEIAAAGCRRGQIKFSSMRAGTHVRPHVGPTNCRLRMHLGLSNTRGTYIRVHQETRQWETGKVLMFDDSFEHEVWHNGTGSRLVLIVDVWHPGLSAAERRQLPAI